MLSVRFQLTVLIFPMAQAVLFGFGLLAILATDLSRYAATLIPALTGVSMVAAFGAAWAIAPRMRARYWRQRGLRGDQISG